VGGVAGSDVGPFVSSVEDDAPCLPRRQDPVRAAPPLGTWKDGAMTTSASSTMTAPAPPRSDFAVLDRLILEALRELRSARTAVARTGNRTNLERQTRAEEHLNALLEYRLAAQRR
jgi:hypothetical protein